MTNNEGGTMIDHNQIQAVLINTAIDDQPTGWLSNNEAVELSSDGTELVIQTYSGDEAYIDLGHLAEIVNDILAGHYDSGLYKR